MDKTGGKDPHAEPQRQEEGAEQEEILIFPHQVTHFSFLPLSLLCVPLRLCGSA